jgi:histidinol phosphatase-like PHP family hydrolase
MLLIELFEGVIKLGSNKPNPDSPSMKFVNELEAISSESPFNHRQRVIGNAKVEVQPIGNITVRLSDIQGSGGTGTQALQTLCQLADKHGVTLKLSAYGYAETPTDTLVAWYEKHGFVVMGDSDGAIDMQRDPT